MRKIIFVMVLLMSFSLVFAVDGNSETNPENYTTYYTNSDTNSENDNNSNIAQNETITPRYNPEQVCTMEYAPVCGTNGKTYGNACRAEAAGIGIAYKGECRQEEIVKEQVKCIFNSNKIEKCYNLIRETPFASTTYYSCSDDTSCIIDIKEEKGKTLEWKSSCGGHTKTYVDGINEYIEFECSPNDEIEENVKCVIWGAKGGEECYSEKGKCTVRINDKGTEKQHGTCVMDVKGRKGETITWKSSCGGYDYTIMDGEKEYAEFYCEKEEDQEEIICTMEYAPVCGTNGKTYGNACRAKAAGIGIAYKGECKERFEGYKSASWTCANGESFEKSSEECKSYGYWKERAIEQCGEPVIICEDSNTSVSGDSNTNINRNRENCTVTGGLKEFSIGDKCGVKCERYEKDGCIITKCSDGRESKTCREEICRKQSIEEIRKIKERCREKNGKVVVDIDKDNGCSHYTCVSEESSLSCRTRADIPKEKKIQCENNGGELLVKVDNSGCVRVLECIKKDSDVSEKNSVNEKILNDETKLLGLALKLENLKIELQKVQAKILAIAEYHAEQGDVNSETKFKNAAGLIDNGVGEIDGLKNYIKENVNDFSKENAEYVREKVREIKQNTLKDVLLAILG